MAEETAPPTAAPALPRADELAYARNGLMLRRTGTVRIPHRGEWYLSPMGGYAVLATHTHTVEHEILERYELPAGVLFLRRTGAFFRRTGEIRSPRDGEWYLARSSGNPVRCRGGLHRSEREILVQIAGPVQEARPRPTGLYLSAPDAGVLRDAALYLADPAFRAEAEQLAATASAGRTSVADTLACALAGMLEGRVFPCGNGECGNTVAALQRYCASCAAPAVEAAA